MIRYWLKQVIFACSCRKNSNLGLLNGIRWFTCMSLVLEYTLKKMERSSMWWLIYHYIESNTNLFVKRFLTHTPTHSIPHFFSGCSKNGRYWTKFVLFSSSCHLEPILDLWSPTVYRSNICLNPISPFPFSLLISSFLFLFSLICMIICKNKIRLLL